MPSFMVVLALAATTGADVKIGADTQKRVDKALAWLAAKQDADGSFTDGGHQHSTAITAFAMLAFMSQGHLPNQGLYGPEVARAARFLIASGKPQEKDTLYLVGIRGGNMYAHAMATLALSELWGQTGDDELKPVLDKAVKLIVNCQNGEGGWRYDPQPTGADISVTIMQVMVLRSARNGGIQVPDATFEKAIKYIKSCYRDKEGGFTYQPKSGAAGFARTAAGCCVLFLSGKYEKKDVQKDYGIDIEKAVAYLKQKSDTGEHFYYGHYYAAHAMHQYGGKDWEEWYAKMDKYFGSQQHLEGSWTNTTRREVGPVYQTSIAVIILSVPAGYLPIFQR